MEIQPPVHPNIRPSNHTPPLSSPKHVTSLLDLPSEVTAQIFTYLDWSDLLTLSHTCSFLQGQAEAQIWDYYNLDPRQRKRHEEEWRQATTQVHKRKDDPMQLAMRAQESGENGYNQELNKLWAALRFGLLERAITSQPQRLKFVKRVCYSIWLSDLEGWNELLAKVWPQLEFVSIDLGVERDTDRLDSYALDH
jgi:hypothetical protein